MNKNRIINNLAKTGLLCFCFFVLTNNLLAQDEKFKALFIYNYTKHILWPADYSRGHFNIEILGSSKLYEELQIIASKKTVNGQTIKVKKVSSVDSTRTCHLLYIPNYNSSKLKQVIAQLSEYPTIIITDNYKLAKLGASINFVRRDGALDYEIFKRNVLKNGIKANPKIFKLGIVYD